MSLLDRCKRGDSGHNGNRDDRPKCHWDCNEEQESRYFVRCGVRKTAAPVHHKCQNLIHDFYRDDYSSPQP